MPFSKSVKREICNADFSARHCRLALLSALICGAARVSGTAVISLKSSNTCLLKKFFLLLRNDFRVVPRVYEKTIFVENTELAKKLLGTLGLWSKGGFERKISGLLTRGSCCKKAYLAGTLLSCGYIGNPKKTYHAEFRAADRHYGGELCALFRHFGLIPRITQRTGRRGITLYFKDGGQIADILNITGAHEAYVFFENVRIRKSVGNTINRSANFNAANVDKAISAAVSHIESIKIIESGPGLPFLPKNLEELARLRLENPEISIKEIGEMLTPPASKSAVNHRLRKIKEIAYKMEEKK